MADFLTHEIEFRGKEIVANRAKKRLVFCGVGALGSRLVDLLASQGYQDIQVIDRERVEAANFGTQNFGLPDVGRMKAAQVKLNLYKRLNVKIESVEGELRDNNIAKLLKGADLVLDLFDNVASRNLVRDYCKAHSVPCLHAGLSGDGFAEIEWNENYTAYPVPNEDPNVPCDYPLAVNLVAFAVCLAAEAVNRYVDTGQKQSVHFTIKDLHVHKL